MAAVNEAVLIVYTPKKLKHIALKVKGSSLSVGEYLLNYFIGWLALL